MKLLVKALKDDVDFKLELTLVAGEKGLARELRHSGVQKSGLALAGFVQSVNPKGVQLLGKTELAYLDSLSAERRESAFTELVRADVACVVVTSGLVPPPFLLEVAEREDVALFCAPLVSSAFIGRLEAFLDEHLSPEITIHGVLVDVFGVGVMLTGPSGIGKSECALELVLHGHRLVSDDVVQIKRRAGQLVGMGSAITKHHMEVRGLGIINIMDLFGAVAVRDRKRIELVVDMQEWEATASYERLGIEEAIETVLGVALSKIVLPIRPGRNVASIVQVAARNHLLKMRGHHSALRFKESLEKRLTSVAPTFAQESE